MLRAIRSLRENPASEGNSGMKSVGIDLKFSKPAGQITREEQKVIDQAIGTFYQKNQMPQVVETREFELINQTTELQQKFLDKNTKDKCIVKTGPNNCELKIEIKSLQPSEQFLENCHYATTTFLKVIHDAKERS